MEKHPNADRLQVCRVDVGAGEPVQVVTGAGNVFEGACAGRAARLPACRTACRLRRENSAEWSLLACSAPDRSSALKRERLQGRRGGRHINPFGRLPA